MAKKGLGLTVGYGISLIGGILSLMIYARMLGPQAYGRLAVYLALVEAFQGICFQWHRLALVRYWNTLPHNERDTYLFTSHLTWIFVGVFGVIVWLLSLFCVGGSQAEWCAVALVALTKSAALYTQEIARASGAILRYSVASFLLTVGATSAGIAVWSATHSMALMLGATATIFIAQTILCGFGHFRILRTAQFDQRQLQKMMGYGLPLIPVFLATAALTRIDRPILEAFESSRVVGIYAATSGLIINAVSAACLLIVTPAYPWLLREKETRSRSDHQLLHARVGLLTLAGMLVVFIIVFLARDIALPLLLGTEIGAPAQRILFPLLSMAIIGAFRMHFFDQSFHLHAKTRILMVINLSTLVVATVSVYLGARLDGLEGLIFGLLIANTFSLFVSAIFARNLVDIRQITTGAIILVVIASFALWCGTLFFNFIERFYLSNYLVTGISTLTGVMIFAGLYIGGNIGSVRGALVGRL
ncbi:lipopolysaccharide biosynthesis protein [Paraburkholderia acidisoli]|uniref:Oligosaccharide flippase family protein n=1 Tax=Paraburkholderia acidisoli TaxID=2571748 RepID=A0A7Z2GIA6_9BURK|nr:oligosaccharide flippase family protein [Paraburkholderia acidisoli]QGZ62312.1 oligosaccharide flippase family protein [Paraburkholderia acidisoli]